LVGHLPGPTITVTVKFTDWEPSAFGVLETTVGMTFTDLRIPWSACKNVETAGALVALSKRSALVFAESMLLKCAWRPEVMALILTPARLEVGASGVAAGRTAEGPFPPCAIGAPAPPIVATTVDCVALLGEPELPMKYDDNAAAKASAQTMRTFRLFTSVPTPLIGCSSVAVVDA